MNVIQPTVQRWFSRCALFTIVFCLSCEEKSPPESAGDPTSAPREPVAEPQTAPPKTPEPSGPPPWANRVSPQGGFPCDVDEVLASSCRRCHWEPQENDAPFPLVMYDDIQKERSGKPIFKLMEQMVAADLMPPLDEPVEPKVAPLTPEQKEILLKWLGAGAPKNEDKCDG